MEKQFDECAICLMPLDNIKDNITVNCCNKQFHNICYIKWMRVKPECPLCRNTINKVNSNIIIEVPEVRVEILETQISNGNNICKWIAFRFVCFLVLIVLVQSYFRF